jgi:hypothetical protein
METLNARTMTGTTGSQSEKVDELMQAGYKIVDKGRDDFMRLSKGNHYVTVFPNGRVAEGEHRPGNYKNGRDKAMEVIMNKANAVGIILKG